MPPEVEVLDCQGKDVLVLERFDRATNGERLTMVSALLADGRIVVQLARAWAADDVPGRAALRQAQPYRHQLGATCGYRSSSSPARSTSRVAQRIACLASGSLTRLAP